ncbi:helix-turn-helix transcriptional regulator [Ruminococcus sp.]|uniref:helix-turn-helix domain-containing protein n=1 Tax=Ruminococcus sp. TaxID=41978 RepID=UPI0025D63915|nr:helix-turn-helix transcriptional regulator [Ruminococcus sp.]
MQNHLYLYPNMVSVRKKKCTQYELAEELGITQQEISRYERGEIKAPINYIIDLAKFCNVSVDYILGLSRDTTDMLSDEDFELLEIYDKLDDSNKIKLKERAATLLEMQTGETD